MTIRKLIEKEPSYYRVNLHAGNVLYLSHAINVKEEEFTNIGIKDILNKIDEIIEVVNKSSSIAMNATIEVQVLALKAQIIKMEAQIAELESSMLPSTAPTIIEDTRPTSKIQPDTLPPIAPLPPIA